MKIPKKYIDLAQMFTTLLDSQFSILGFKIGIDPFLDLIPGIGNIIGAIISCYLIFLAVYFRLPTKTVIAMVGNIIIDYVLGILPLIGFISDIVFKANLRNLALLKQFADTGDILQGELIE